MKVAIITKYNDAYKDMAEITSENKKRYAERHGYTFIEDNGPYDKTDRSYNWAKLPAIQRHVKDFDWVMWSDCDSIIMDQSKRLEELIDARYGLIASLFFMGGASKFDYTIHLGNFFVKFTKEIDRVFNVVNNCSDPQMLSSRMHEEEYFTHIYRKSQKLRKQTKLLKLEKLMASPSLWEKRPYGSKDDIKIYKPGDFIFHCQGPMDYDLRVSLLKQFNEKSKET